MEMREELMHRTREVEQIVEKFHEQTFLSH